MPNSERQIRMMWWVMAIVVLLLVVQYAANMVLIDECRSALTRNEERSVRADNEVLALAWCCASKLDVPHLSAPEPKLVRPIDLVESFWDSSAYEGVEVVVPVWIGSVRENAIGWHVGKSNNPAAIEFRFSDALNVKQGELVWIVGKCRGREDDGAERESPRLKYKVIVEDCRILRTGDK